MTFQVEATYGADSDTDTIVITVNNNINEAPTASAGNVTVDEDNTATVTLAGTDLNPADTITTYRVETLPNNGTLKLGGAAVNVSDTVTAAQIVAGDLTFDPDGNWNGVTGFTFKVSDWADWSANTATHSITVTAVNDVPTTTNIADVNVNEDAADTVVDLFGEFDDIEDADADLIYTITSNTNGGLFDGTTIDGVAGTLTLDYAANQSGNADITVRATDSGGLWVEDTFTVTVYGLDDGLVGHWELDDAGGGTAADSSDNGNNGTLTGGTWTYGWLGGGLECNGNSDYVSVPNAGNLQLTNILTISAWIKGDSWSSGTDVDIIARKGENNPNNYQLAVADGQVTLYLDDGDNNGFRGDTVLNTDQWYHVAATWDGTTVEIYVDGVLVLCKN
ncbi:MAG: hypothetical protein KAT56_08065 [Sedimentisphaerales bacterium]|nr:hypothetical protein [Sedimentisphaerales bacterium]